MYFGYMGLMLTLGAAEGLMASVVVYYIARLAGAPLSDTGRPLKRPLIFEKLIAKTPAALQENKRAVVLGEQTFGKGIVQTIQVRPLNFQPKVPTS